MTIPKRKKRAALSVQVVAVQTPTVLVTLDDPKAWSAKAVAGAFVRLRPPEGMTTDEIAAWRAAVAKVAIDVKVLPPPKADDVPNASARVDVGEKVGNIREEAMRIARETERSAVIEIVDRTLAQVGL